MILRLKSLFIATSTLLLLSACGSPIQTSEFSDLEHEPKSLFIVMGGNASCRSEGSTTSPYFSGLYKSFAQHIWKAKPANSKLIVSCYISSEPQVYFSYAEKPEEIFEVSREEFTASVNQKIADKDQIYMIGHSYGGWLSMKLALDSKSSRNESSKLQLYSVDPISRETCTFSAPYGCTEAPSDIENPQREDLANMTTTWHNYFQTRTWYLHSSKISHADVNIEYRTSHGRIATNIDMWRDIVKGIGIGQVDPTFTTTEDPSLLVSQ